MTTGFLTFVLVLYAYKAILEVYVYSTDRAFAYIYRERK